MIQYREIHRRSQPEKRRHWLADVGYGNKGDRVIVINTTQPIPPAYGDYIIQNGDIVGAKYRCPWCNDIHELATNGTDNLVLMAACNRGFIRFLWDEVRQAGIERAIDRGRIPQ